jgi:hypothetical protein
MLEVVLSERTGIFGGRVKEGVWCGEGKGRR